MTMTMTNNPTQDTVNRSCKYDYGMVCFYTKVCTFPTLAICLQQNLYLAHKEISLLKESQSIKHSQMSLKWRNTAFYYKKRCRALEALIQDRGLELPNTQDLLKVQE